MPAQAPGSRRGLITARGSGRDSCYHAPSAKSSQSPHLNRENSGMTRRGGARAVCQSWTDQLARHRGTAADAGRREGSGRSRFVHDRVEHRDRGSGGFARFRGRTPIPEIGLDFSGHRYTSRLYRNAQMPAGWASPAGMGAGSDLEADHGDGGRAGVGRLGGGGCGDEEGPRADAGPGRDASPSGLQQGGIEPVRRGRLGSADRGDQG